MAKSFDALVKKTTTPAVRKRAAAKAAKLIAEMPFKALPYKNAHGRQTDKWEIYNRQGQAMGLPMTENETNDALRWLDLGYEQAKKDLA